ncbi:MAG TPA: sigma-70 family RNA polymerase sigma factor [Verrucomicrobiales bacterium]|nr:sigma-70 family RNA polymerase sigma factor [Verrucomicrobiales bacterium]
MEDTWQNWLQSRSEEDFRSVVRCHLPLVLATAQRRTNGDATLAQDISQLVFIDLARNSKALPKGVVLAGWLYRHTCFTASKVLRTERRRSARERMAAGQESRERDVRGEHAVDGILEKLPAKDRHALLLRFAEDLPLQGVADALGISRVAAQKRIERALTRVRENVPEALRSRVSSAAGFTALLIPAQSKTAAAALSPAVEQVALLAGKTGKTALFLTFFRSLGAMQSAALGVAVSVIVWAVPVAVQVRALQNRTSAANAVRSLTKAAAADAARRPRVSAEEAGKRMASVFLTRGFSTESAKLALGLLKPVAASERLDAVQAMLGALPAGSARSASVAVVLQNFAQGAAWHPKKYPDDVLTALELMPRQITPEFDDIIANHPDVDATVRLHREIQRLNEARPLRHLPSYSRATARALAGRNVRESLDFCKACVKSGEASEALEGLTEGAAFADQRKGLWDALATESDRKFQTEALAKLTEAAPTAESSAVIDRLPPGNFRNDAATLLARQQLAAQEHDTEPMAVNAVADAWLARIPAEERAEQFRRLFEFRSGSYDRMEDFFRRLSTEFTGPDLDRLLHQCVSVFASVSSPPKSALDAWAKIADPDIRFSAGCELVSRWSHYSTGANSRQEAKQWMKSNFTSEQQAAYKLLHNRP